MFQVNTYICQHTKHHANIYKLKTKAKRDKYIYMQGDKYHAKCVYSLKF